MMKYFLKKTSTIFYDGHGEGSSGSEDMEVLTHSEMKHKEEVAFILDHAGKPYVGEQENENTKYGDYILLEDDETEYHEEDGYHMTSEEYIAKEISKEEYDRLKVVISEYENAFSA